MRLIDADAFIAKLNHVPMVQEAIRKAMDTMPTIEERKTGKWLPDCEYDGEDEWCFYTCSCCEYQSDDQFNYCPSCGADMREQP